MGLWSDLEEAKAVWSKSSFFMKVAICTSLFLSVSSVTSLSSTVFAWRGFIRDAIHFYREWISDPLRNLLFHAHLDYSSLESDVLILLLIVTASYIRFVAVTRQLTNTNPFGVTNTNPLGVLSLFVPATMGMAIMADSENFESVAFGVAAVVGGIYITHAGIGIYYWRTKPRGFNKIAFLSLVGPPLLAIGATLFLGAVNAGLSKPLN